MSGLERFQANEAWRNNFKKFLFMERKPETVQNSSITTESHRYSLDIGEDLKSIIEEKKNKKGVQINLNEENISLQSITNEHFQKQKSKNMNSFDETAYGELPMWQKKINRSFETLKNVSKKTISDHEHDEHEEEVQKSNNTLVLQNTSDESFQALEKMCDKTASDPNSTLFQYLHSDRKEQVLAEVKKRSADGNIDCRKYEDANLAMKLNNCTLLEDIEAPSRLWENTICGETIVQTSPVKMVGLLRPSTIIEEAPDDSTNSDMSSQMSFRTACKGGNSDVSSSAYETAYDSTVANIPIDISNKSHKQDINVIDVDHILFSAFEKNEQYKKDAKSVNIPAREITDVTIVASASLGNKLVGETGDERNVSMDLIDLEKTIRPLHVSQHFQEVESIEKIQKNANKPDSYNVLDDSIIEILSDEGDVDEIKNFESEDEQTFGANIKSEMNTKTSSFSINHNTFSFHESLENDKENCSESHEPSVKSMQFNDTMEEVEYILKKGMEYKAAEFAAAAKSPINSKTSILVCNDEVGKTKLNSPMPHMKPATVASSSASKVTPSNYKTSAKKISTKGIDLKPFPKLDIFAKPSIHARTKELASKQQKFSHIVSPIGAYMKKTAKTPLMSSINSKNKDYFNSTAILELENESRLYQPQFTKDSNECETSELFKLPGLTGGAKRPLPKKAYISSDLKHIVDERTPVTIPGGKKIQKYLENAMMPAVLRHEGKLKMPGSISNKLNTSTTIPSKLPLKVSDTNSTPITKTSLNSSRRNDASLADLSVMSGDVSMYTIKDAQKF